MRIVKRTQLGSSTHRGQSFLCESDQYLPNSEELPDRAEIIRKHRYASITLEALEFHFGRTLRLCQFRVVIALNPNITQARLQRA